MLVPYWADDTIGCKMYISKGIYTVIVIKSYTYNLVNTTCFRKKLQQESIRIKFITSEGQQFHQYQQREQAPLASIY